MDATTSEILSLVREEDVKFIRLAYCDLYGTQKNMAIMASQLPRAFAQGIPFDASAAAGFATPEHTDLFLDVHLMVEKPGRYVEAFARAGADLLSVHLEADLPPAIHDALGAMEANGVKKAVALRPITAAEAVLPYLEEGVDLVLVMTVEPGFGGQKFMTDQLAKIRTIRSYIDRYQPGCDLEVDGGINLETAKLVTEAGANVLVAGSAVYGAADPAAMIAALRG